MCEKSYVVLKKLAQNSNPYMFTGEWAFRGTWYAKNLA